MKTLFSVLFPLCIVTLSIVSYMLYMYTHCVVYLCLTCIACHLDTIVCFSTNVYNISDMIILNVFYLECYTIKTTLISLILRFFKKFFGWKSGWSHIPIVLIILERICTRVLCSLSPWTTSNIWNFISFSLPNALYHCNSGSLI